MPADGRRLILGNGEKLVVEVTKTLGGRGSPLPRSYDEARDRVFNQISSSLRLSESFTAKERYPNELFLCFRLHPDMLAKSYDPEEIFFQVPDLKNVGSRSWRPNLARVAQTERVKKERAKNPDGTGISRLLFVRGTEEGFERLQAKLNLRSSLLPKKFQEDIQKLEEVGFLHPDEQLQGFLDTWKGGRVELVLHPSRRGKEQQLEFVQVLQDELGIPEGKSKVATYGFGPAFVSTRLDKDALQRLSRFNPLRTVHPLEFDGVPTLRSSPKFKAPPPPADSTTTSTIKVGIFDGGVDLNCPHLKGFVEEDSALSIKTRVLAPAVEHGTAVAGAVLYGPIEKHDPGKPLPQPPVSVVSFRAFPPSDLSDPDLHECIDVIENAVPARPDISIYNVSFGPKGPILDDSVSRFTFALDQLTVNNNVLFFVAVGNAGEDAVLSRIWAPSDFVNGVSVGAYTIRKGQKVRAPYSCVGPGREGGKIKPDVCAFGGCDTSPIHLISTSHGMKVLQMGTSFASPIAASLGAQASGLYERATPLLSRALITHTATHPLGEVDHELGHGCIPDSVLDVLNCPNKGVTVAFQGNLEPKTFYKLPIPLPESVKLSGTVEVSWTVAALCPVEMDHPGDYTSCCIEDTFYPNSDVFNFSAEAKPGKKSTKRLHIRDDREEIQKLGPDWKKSSFPAPRSGNLYPTEREKRELDYKWDTIVRRSVSLMGKSLYLPFLVLHAIPRRNASEGFPYAAVVTIRAPKYDGDLHNEIMRRYPVLQPIRVRNEAEIRVKI